MQRERLERVDEEEQNFMEKANELIPGFSLLCFHFSVRRIFPTNEQLSYSSNSLLSWIMNPTTPLTTCATNFHVGDDFDFSPKL
jgi:hypothetical protein